VSILDFTTPKFDVLEDVGVVQLLRTGREIRVRIVAAPDGTGPRIDVREFMTDEFWHRVRDAQARAAATGRKIRGPTRPQQFTGPTRRGFWLQPFAADELGELLALAVVKAEALGIETE
jgi:hypothetical protein